MKFFSNILAVASVVLVGVLSVVAHPAPRAAKTSPQDVENAIQMVTTMSSTLQTSVAKLDILTFPLQGGIIASGLGNITNTVGQFTANLSGPPFSDNDALVIVDVLTTFVRVHQLLLSTIIGKHSLASMFFLTAPIADALRAIESVVDAFAFALIDLIPTQSGPANAQINALSGTFTQANNAYAS
ncbi:hypothetical protein C8Q80DRAFT_283024 [Daedaleopsis nitida]|nr:hypothetical protein C8Q80DRAFT_283024 [Daedaleopsis nitida]